MSLKEDEGSNDFEPTSFNSEEVPLEPSEGGAGHEPIILLQQVPQRQSASSTSWISYM